MGKTYFDMGANPRSKEHDLELIPVNSEGFSVYLETLELLKAREPPLARLFAMPTPPREKE